MVSIICCYNKPHEYQELLESLKKQNVVYEVIAVDNVDQGFTSAAAALNSGAQSAKGDVLVFLHQDIIFLDSDSLSKLVTAVSACENRACVVGVFGASHKQKGYVGEFLEQDSLDECCVAMTKKTWESFKFNASLCDGWHLYVVELCIRVRQAGGLVLSGNFDIRHLSTGNVDEAYMATYRRLLTWYKSEKWICTTCKSMPTNLLWFEVYYLLWKIKKRLFGNYNLSYKLKNLFRKKR